MTKATNATTNTAVPAGLAQFATTNTAVPAGLAQFATTKTAVPAVLAQFATTKTAVPAVLAVLAGLALLAATSGCYNTVVMSGAPPAGPEIEERQWFTIGGLVPLSSPAGATCGPAGLSRAESRMGGVDILIDVGLSVAGGILGASVCNIPDNPSDDEVRTYGTCVAGVGALVPFLFATRTVRYTCAGR